MNIINLNDVSARLTDFWNTPCAIAFICTESPTTSGLVVCNLVDEGKVTPVQLTEQKLEVSDSWEAIETSADTIVGIRPSINFASAAEFISPPAAAELKQLESRLLSAFAAHLADGEGDVSTCILSVTQAFLAEIEQQEEWDEDCDLQSHAENQVELDVVRFEAATFLSQFVDQAKVSIIGCEDLADARLTNGASPGWYHLHLKDVDGAAINDPMPIHVEDGIFLEDLTAAQRVSFTCRICELLTELPFEHVKTIEELEVIISEIEL